MRIFFDSVANRVFLILLTGILVAAGTTSWLDANQQRKVFKELYEFRIAERIEQMVFSIDQVGPEIRAAVLQNSENFGFESSLVKQPEQSIDDNPSLTSVLKNRLGDNHQVLVVKQSGCKLHGYKNLDFERLHECQAAYVTLNDGALLKIKFRTMGKSGNKWPYSISYFFPYFCLILLSIGGLAFIVAKMIARPIQLLANAAGELGSDIDRPPLNETGPTEIRQAAIAFNAMQARIKRQIQHRTHMLAAITHDLQTPLTRLRLRLEKVAEARLRSKLLEDLALMQSMVHEGLDLARSMDSAEEMQKLDIDSLLDSVCADAIDAGQDVSLAGRTRVSIMAQPNTLRRCLTNLIDNAIKYGYYARLQLTREGTDVVITIRDGGGGIPVESLEMVFDPFYRLETSRSRDTGGTGLGLAIARNIAENHRASLQLRNHPAGGLVAILRLPGLSGIYR